MFGGRCSLGLSLSFFLRCWAFEKRVYSVDRLYGRALRECAAFVRSNPFDSPDNVPIASTALVMRRISVCNVRLP